MRSYDVIKKKRQGYELSPIEIEFMVNGATDSTIPDYQTSAFLMATCLNGMTDAETIALTKAMLASGTTLDTSGINGIKADKHSTGGVGDKTSLIIAPIVSAMGVKVPMISGRGLGHTGGTLDKLSSIPGMRVDLSEQEALGNLESIGMFITGQTDSIAPADKKLYALRDLTATVDSIPLITASILSKKLSEGIDALVLDVKSGHGAFMKTPEDAKALAMSLISTSKAMGVHTAAIITDMHQPIGRCVGNALEVKECITALKGKGADDLMHVTYTLAAWMLSMSDALGDESTPGPISEFGFRNYKHEMMEFIEKGDAFRKFAQFIDAQGGSTDAILNPGMLPRATDITEIKADEDGYIRGLNAEAVGTATMLLGAGRQSSDATIDHSAGIILNSKVGAEVKKGDTIALMHHNASPTIKDAEEVFRTGIEIGKRELAPRPLIIEAIIS